MIPPLRDLFQQTFGKAPTVAAAAPGRVEFIGNHTDYNGGAVLGAAIDRFVRAAAAPRNDSILRIKTDIVETMVELPVSILSQEPDVVHEAFGDQRWARYPLGTLWILKQEYQCPLTGADVLLTSDLPTGAGLSSSAAVELSALLVWGALYDVPLTMEKLPAMGRRSENEFVGVPCGILDQGCSTWGMRDHLVHIDCANEHFARVPLPPDLHFWIFDTNVKHSFIDTHYKDRHAECMTARNALRADYPGLQHLAALTPPQFEASRHLLSEVEALRAAHVIQEHARVAQMQMALTAGNLDEAGRLLYASHESSRDLFENSTSELDTFVDLLRKESGVIGARLTGGGFGGAVMALTTADFTATQADAVALAFHRRYDPLQPAIRHIQTGDGARLIEI